MNFKQVNEAFKELVTGEAQRLSLLKAVAVIFAEHDAMKARLLELEEVYDEIPLRWRSNGEPLVPNLMEAIDKFTKGQV